MSDLFGGALPFPIDVQIAEVEREIALRRRVYPRWIASGRMSQPAADRQIAVMGAVLESLRSTLRGVE